MSTGPWALAAAERTVPVEYWPGVEVEPSRLHFGEEVVVVAYEMVQAVLLRRARGYIAQSSLGEI